MGGSYDQFQKRRATCGPDWQAFKDTFLVMEWPDRLKAYADAVKQLPGGTDGVVIEWELDGETQSFERTHVCSSVDDS